jgi:hypothetical protein
MHDAPVESNVISRSGAHSERRDLTVEGDAPGPDPLLSLAA